MAMVPLACVLINIFALSFRLSFPPENAHGDVVPVAATISGSEATVFLALIYALVMMVYAVHRSISEAPKVEKAAATAS